jgi:transposase
VIEPETVAEIRRLFYAEHWKIGTIASFLRLHHATVRAAVEGDRTKRPRQIRASLADPYLPFIRQTLEQYPRLRATRLYEMVKARGYPGGVRRLREIVRPLRPQVVEPFLRLSSFPGEQAQVDWADFGAVTVGRATRRLSCFVMTLSHSRALFLEFFFDQTQESFLRGHVRAFSYFAGVPRVVLYDNLRSAVLERRGELVRFHPRLIELCAHYHFQARPCAPARGNEKGRVERAIRYIRESFFYGRVFTTLEDFNHKARVWRDEVAHARKWPDDQTRSVAEAFAAEQPRLLPLPAHPFETDLLLSIRSKKTIYVRFDRNDYSIPPDAVGKMLSLAASDTELRIFEGTTLRVTHRRSYDQGRRIEDPSHQEALLAIKRKAKAGVASARLTSVAPECEAFLDAAFLKGEHIGSLVQKLTRLLDDYGDRRFKAALCEALERGTPRASSVAYLLERRRRSERSRTAMPVDLSRRPDLADLVVQPHEGGTYDQLSRRHSDDPEE